MSHDNIIRLLHEVSHDAPSGRTFKQIAELMGKAYSTLASELNDELPSHKFGAADLPLFMELTDSDAPVDYLAARRRGVFLKLPLACAGVDRGAIAAVKEFGELMAAYGEALEDGTITKAERLRINREGYEAVRAIMALLHGLDQ